MSNESIVNPTYVLYPDNKCKNDKQMLFTATFDGIDLRKLDPPSSQFIEWHQIRAIKLNGKHLSIYLLGEETTETKLKLYSPKPEICKLVYDFTVLRHAEHLKQEENPQNDTILSCFQNVVKKFIPRSKESGDIKQNLHILTDRCDDLSRVGVLNTKHLTQIKLNIHKLQTFVENCENNPSTSDSLFFQDATQSDREGTINKTYKSVNQEEDSNSKTFRRPSQESLLMTELFHEEMNENKDISIGSSGENLSDSYNPMNTDLILDMACKKNDKDSTNGITPLVDKPCCNLCGLVDLSSDGSLSDNVFTKNKHRNHVKKIIEYFEMLPD